jgi:hypothetical protein
MKSFPSGPNRCEAERRDAIGRLLRAQFDQIAKAPASRVLVDLADRLEAKAARSAAVIK